ncbi:trehalose-phosphatase [Leekyejoonella antrihumi]|uniref:Trehalose 6-phosphate phosphatase n=1 Tax=Leekyejoonella antrihumi TaxID=1660198 RepID=A0A563EAP1_9MICO|nr:trehalose-phosphatase [Leekyejoonella antrihumi]TWP38864.1 trehalose-phosphatase [Leekyejoonella antrihumi]
MNGLSGALTDALAAYAGHDRILFGTDFDGVLAPLVQDPSTSRPVAGSMEALRALAGLPGVEVAIVSGRDLATLTALTGPREDDDIVLVGSHGAEASTPLPHIFELDDDAQEKLEQVSVAMKSVALAHPGTRVEHKQAGVALHTRGLDPQVAAGASRAAARIPEQVHGTHLMLGKDVVEVTVLDVSKGVALHSLRDRSGASVVCYLGDDRTDELAFAVLDAAAGNVTIKVGPGDTAAAHRIPDPAQVLEVIAEVLRLRRTVDTVGQNPHHRR